MIHNLFIKIAIGIGVIFVLRQITKRIINKFDDIRNTFITL